MNGAETGRQYEGVEAEKKEVEILKENRAVLAAVIETLEGLK